MAENNLKKLGDLKLDEVDSKKSDSNKGAFPRIYTKNAGESLGLTIPDAKEGLNYASELVHDPVLQDEEKEESVNNSEIKVQNEIPQLSEEIYPIVANRIGYALIINNMTFTFEKPRTGSEVDFKNMKQLLVDLGYTVEAHENLKTEEMSAVFRKFSEKEEHYSQSSCIVVISTHGYCRHGILGTDEDYLDIDFDVLPYFNNSHCPALQKKPKLFFIQACRGDQIDDGVDVVDAKVLCSSPSPKERIPIYSDTLIVHSTSPGFVSNRNRIRGSWFFESIVKVFSEYASSCDIETMLKMVTDSIMKRETCDGEMQTPEILLRGWRKKFYFNPR